MATPRSIRRKALQALYQLDARGESDVEVILESLVEEEFARKDANKAMDLALGAWRGRAEADADIRTLAPEWPAHRQPAVDRAILRLSHFEMTSGRAHPKIAVNEAVRLAKEFSTDRSPAFVNGVLDKVLKRVLAAHPALAAETPIEDHDEPMSETPSEPATPAGPFA